MRYGIPLLITFIVAGGRTQRRRPRTVMRRGAALFQLRCSDCHGVDAGAYGPDLTVLFGTARLMVGFSDDPPGVPADGSNGEQRA
jgi:hypothetical protein